MVISLEILYSTQVINWIWFFLRFFSYSMLLYAVSNEIEVLTKCREPGDDTFVQLSFGFTLSLNIPIVLAFLFFSFKLCLLTVSLRTYVTSARSGRRLLPRILPRLLETKVHRSRRWSSERLPTACRNKQLVQHGCLARKVLRIKIKQEKINLW